MPIKSKRKVESDMNWWLRNAFFSLVTLCAVFDHCRWAAVAQTYCEDKPKILFYRRGQAALVSGGDNNENSNHVVVSNVNKEFLACVSSRNVEWTYEGQGEPSKFQESSTVDIQKYEDGSISYCLTSQITFSNKQSDTELSRHTGKYSCREIGNVSNTVSVYVFASRKNSPTFLQSRKTMTLSLGPGNITTYPASVIHPVAAHSVVGASSDSNVNAATQVFTIPCVTTHPNVTVKLLRKEKSNKFLVYNGGILLFDPKFGFFVNTSRRNSNDLSEFYGEYKCVSSAAASRKGHSQEDSTNSKMEVDDFVFITLVKSKSFQVYPPIQEVYTAGMLNLTCESEEPVIMKEVLPSSAQDVYSYLDEDDYGRDRSDDIVETTERTDQKSHIANYMEIAPAPGRSGEIQCLTEKDGKVLHTWRYRIIRKRAEKLSGIKFNKREKSFTCKSKLGAPGRLSFISCRTPSECRINGVCLTKSENCRGYSNSTRAFCERKSHFCGKIFYKGGSGLIRCIGEGIDEIRGFTDEASADHTVRMGFGKLKASETALLKLAVISVKTSKEGQQENLQKQQQQVQKKNENVEGTSTIYEGEQVNVTLQMGYYYFLYPVQWAVKFRNGSTAQINPDSQYLQVERLFRTVYASLTLPYTSATTFMKYNGSSSSDNVGVGNGGNGKNASSVPQPAAIDVPHQPSEIIALHALIPLRASVDPSWKTISLPLTVFGHINVPQPVDTESDELLVEQVFHQPHINSTSSVTAPASSDDDEAVPVETGAIASESENDDDEDEDEDVDDELDSEQSSILNVSGSSSSASKNSTNEESTKSLGLNETLSIIEDENSDKSNSSSGKNDAEEQKEISTTQHDISTITSPTTDHPLDVNESSKLPAEIKAGVTDGGLNTTTGNFEKPSLSSLGEGANTFENTSLSEASSGITPDHIPDATSRDTKIKETSEDAEWMIVEKNQADETLFLARSGLLFDDEDIINSSSSSENEGSKSEDESGRRDTVFATTEISTFDNDDEREKHQDNNDTSISSATEIEEASTVPSAQLLEESH